jgi:glutathione S-transferase
MAFKIIGAGLSPFVRKTRAFFAEKGIPYELEPLIPFGVSAEYKRKSPLGKIPCLEHDGRALPDSSVICAYVEKVQPQPPLYPSDPWDYARALWFEEYADGGVVANAMAPIFVERVVKKLMGGQPDEARAKETEEKVLPGYCDYLEGQLGDQQYLVGGRFSIADIAVASPFVNLAHAGVKLDAKRWPKLAAYLDRIHSRPSFKGLIEEDRAGLPKS